jgi:GTPase SAR1 family protein
MAIIYNYPENDANIQLGEKIIADFLKKLPDDYYIYHSLHFVKEEIHAKHSPFNEIDFLIAHPDKGILVCEVKNLRENTEFSTIEKAFILRDRNGNIIGHVNPYVQCNHNYHNFISKLTKQSRRRNEPQYFLDKLIGQLILFPTNHLTHKQSSVFDEWIKYSMDKAQINDGFFEKGLEEVFEYWKNKFKVKGPLGHEGIARLKEILQTNISVSSVFDMNYLQFGNKKIQTLTDEQIEFLANGIKSNHQFLVNGCAGSGKTFLALKLAEEFSNQDYQVLFLTFNKKIYEWVNQALEVDKSCNIVQNDIALHYYYIFERDILPLNGHFDVVLVDEGQDFSQEQWDIIFNQVVIPNASRIFIFYDDKQGIFNRNSIEYVKAKYRIPEFKLTQNVRNSRKICNLLKNFDPIILNKVDAEGLVKFVKYQNINDIVYCIDAELKLLSNNGVQPKDIVFLNHFSTRNRFSIILGEEIKDYFQGIEPFRDKNKDYTTYFYFKYFDSDSKEYEVYTINRFKGLESDIIILLDIENILSQKNRNFLLYTAVSRAKLGLIILYPEKMEIKKQLQTVFKGII